MDEEDSKVRRIRVGIFDDGFMIVWGSTSFEDLLMWDNKDKKKRFSWKKKGVTYLFETQMIKDENILNGDLQNFDVLIFGAVDQYNKLGLWKIWNKDKFTKWINNVIEFIKNGGGYVGHCGGANLICSLNNEPNTFLEHMINDSGFGIVDTKAIQNISIPVLDQLHPKGSPEDIGEAAYVLYEGMNPDPSLPQAGGVPMDLVVKNPEHPILKGFKGETIKIRWGGGPRLVPGKNTQEVLAYPKTELSHLHQLGIWKYVGTGEGGYLGKLNGIIKSIKRELFPHITNKELRETFMKLFRELRSGEIDIKTFFIKIYEYMADEEETEKFIDILARGLWKSIDWKPTGKFFKTDFANKTAMVTETHGKGRIVISGPHPEDPIWNNGKIVNKPDTSSNSIWDGLVKWQGRTNIGNPNSWFLRREVAWAAGLKEHELPPIPDEYRKPEPEPEPGPSPTPKPKTIIELIIEFLQKLFKKQ